MLAATDNDSGADLNYLCAASMHAVAVKRMSGLHVDSLDDPNAAAVMQQFTELVRGKFFSGIGGCV